MPNHFHLLIKIKNKDALLQTIPKFKTLESLRAEEKEKTLSNLLSKQFSNFFSSYSQAFNKVYKRRGSLFIKNFKRKEVATDEYMRMLILYIHLNPVKHGFVSISENWQWTSFNEFLHNQPDLLNRLFGNTERYNSQHHARQREFKEYQILESELT